MAPQSLENPGNSVLFGHITTLKEKLPLHAAKWLHQLRQCLLYSSNQEEEKRKGVYTLLEGHSPKIAHVPSVRVNLKARKVEM